MYRSPYLDPRRLFRKENGSLLLVVGSKTLGTGLVLYIDIIYINKKYHNNIYIYIIILCHYVSYVYISPLILSRLLLFRIVQESAHHSDHSGCQEATRKDPLYFGWKANLSMVKTLGNGTVMALQQLKQPKYPFLVMVSPNLGTTIQLDRRFGGDKVPRSATKYNH